jgi:transcriptional regulator with XRE-family HTH domain
MADDETPWVTRLLETSIEASGLSQRDLERRLGWKKGTLGKILQDGTALEHQQILEVLGELNRDSKAGDPAKPRSGGGRMVGALLDRFHGLGYAAVEPEAVVEPAWEGGALEHKVQDALTEAFGSLEGDGSEIEED